MLTLHGYILRELTRSFALTIVALSGLFTMAGGLFNIVRYEAISASDLFTILPMLLPIVITLTMPVAALFATTMVYGRLAADNEFVAARAAGINIRKLFLSAVLLSVFVALFTMLSVNYIIPHFIYQIDRYARSNIRDLAFQQLRTRGHVRFSKAQNSHFILTCQDVRDVSDEALIENGFDPQSGTLSYFWIDWPTFLWLHHGGDLERFAYARGGLCQFDTSSEKLYITVYVKDVHDFEVGKQDIAVGEQKIGPHEVPIPMRLRPTMVDLNTLWGWRVAPWRVPEVYEKLTEFRHALIVYQFYTDTAARLGEGDTLAFAGREERTVRVAGRPVLAQRDFRLTDVRAEIDDGGDLPIRYEAGAAEVHTDAAQLTLELELRRFDGEPVREFVPRLGAYGDPKNRDEQTIGPLQIPQPFIDRVNDIPDDQIVSGAAFADELPPPLANKLDEIRRKSDRFGRRIFGLLHFRLGFAVSPLVTVVMGAALGLIFRGNRALSAFGLACIPFGSVIILLLTGRQIAENPATQAIGPFVIWGALVVGLIANIVIIRRGVQT